MATEEAINAFLRALSRKGDESGWPVNALKVDWTPFAGDERASSQCTRDAVHECVQRGFVSATFDDNIHGIKLPGKARLAKSGG